MFEALLGLLRFHKSIQCPRMVQKLEKEVKKGLNESKLALENRWKTCLIAEFRVVLSFNFPTKLSKMLYLEMNRYANIMQVSVNFVKLGIQNEQIHP